MKKYATYKQSGIEWLGEIPEHWERKRLKDYMGVNMGQSPDSESYNDEGFGLPFYQGNADFGELYPIKRIYCDEPKKIATKNDILISVRAPVGEMNISDSECCIGRGLTALTVKTGDYKYAYYLLSVIKEELKMFVTGSTFEAVSANDISVIKYLNPSQTEQTDIANYLDDRTAKLDKLIKNKEYQIEKLKEMRQIEINTSVTKGLNPKAKMKNSGIDWHGDIPEHWEIKRLKDKVRVNIESLGTDTDQGYRIQYLDISNVDSTGVTGEIQELQFFEAPSRARRVVRNEDIVMSTVRPYLKAIAYLDNVPDNMIASTGFAVMTCKKRYNATYLFYLTVCHWFNSTINSQSVGASYPAVNNDVLVATNILCPPFEEQIEISNYLNRKIGTLDKMIKNVEHQVGRLKEIRKIEIYNAVTGKIKVV